MRIYAERPGRAALQVLADVAVLVWVVVGDDLARALGTGTGAGDSLSASGRELAALAASAGSAALVAIVLLGVVPVVTVWLALRARWVLAPGSARTARDTDPHLLALHALTRPPTRRLLALTPDPGGARRRGDPAAVAGLAAVELAALGLRAPE